LYENGMRKKPITDSSLMMFKFPVIAIACCGRN
jgi:hypothetical protein